MPLSDEQRAQLAARLRRGRAAAPAPAGIPSRSGPDPAPLSFGQEQLWFVDRFAPGQATYNIGGAILLTGPLDVFALHRAVQRLLERHEALRTRLVDRDGRAVQVVDPVPAASAGVRVLDATTPAGREEQLWDLVAAEIHTPFSLSDGPLFRYELVQLDTERHAVVFGVHHVVFDGWSMGVFQRELAALYGAEVTGDAPGLPELTIQFGDYAAWERERLSGDSLQRLVDYWCEHLSGAGPLELPTDRPRPPLESHRGGIVRLELDLELLAAVQQLAHATGTTVFQTLLAATVVLLARHSGQDDIVIGTPSANRTRPELAPLIGYLVNTLPIRTDVGDDPSFRELLARVKATTTAAYAHQDLPFGKLVEALDVGRDVSRTPVYQVSFTHTELAGEPLRAGGVEFRFSDGGLDPGTAKFDLALFAGTSADEFHVLAQYAEDLFDRATVEALLARLATLLRAAVSEPHRRVSELLLLRPEEVEREVEGWHGPVADYPAETLATAFARQVAATPEAVAVEYEASSLTYGELARAAYRIAHELQANGVGPESLVGLAMRPSPHRVAALLGVLLAGGAYVPLDPHLPPARLAYLVDDAAAPVVLADADSTLPPGLAARVLTLAGSDAFPERPEVAPAVALRPDQLAYVLYTSGSTGQPKGVQVEHRQVMNLVNGMCERWPIGPGTRFLQFASLSFDASVLDHVVTLLSGATLVLAPADTLHSPPQLARLLRDARITAAHLPPAVLALLDAGPYPDLGLVFIGGEALPAALAERFLAEHRLVVNAYGPTETTVVATTALIDGTDAEPPIGRPVPNARAYVLDAHRRPVPPGVTGELWVAGAGVARGYHRRPELTAERFVDDPFRPGARMYRTGDLARRRRDGALVYAGRIDDQVKLHGQRVELGEIEAALGAVAGVAQAVVVLADGGQDLVAYVRPGGPHGVDVAAVRAELAQRLPAALVPTRWVTVDRFALTPSGKIDKRALPSPEVAPAGREVAPPRTDTERAVVAIVGEVLGRDDVGVEDSFFDLGGNSLQAMRLVSRLEHELGHSVGVSAVFLAPSPRQLAVRLAAQRRAGTAVRAGGGPLVRLADGLGETPLYLVHAVGGTVFGYLPLAAELADSYRPVGIEAAGLQSGTPAGSVPELVDAYAAAIRADQPDGPYRLGGWSLGGVIAFELAQRLVADGAEVELLALLDAPAALPPSEYPDDAGAVAAFVADAARTVGLDGPGPDPAADPETSLGWLAAALGDAGDPHVRAELRRRAAVFTRLRQLFAGYRPVGQVHAPTALISAHGSPNAAAQPHWTAHLAGPVTAAYVDGDHYSFLREPQAAEVAALIAKADGR